MDKKFLDKCIETLVSGKIPALAPANFRLACGRPEDPKFLWLRRSWSQEQLPVERAVATIWADAGHLCVFAMMEDSDVFSEAKGRNDRTWDKGDVLELFFQPNGRRKYYELHVAPNLATLELAIPDVDDLLSGRLVFDSLFFDSGMKCSTGLFKSSGIAGWWGLMEVGIDAIGLQLKSGTLGKIAVCRYNYNRTGDTKRLQESASAPFPKLRFHDPENWHSLVLD